jgi:conjugative transposon TraM protein
MKASTPLSAKQERQRKFLLVLPVLVLPFVTFLLWSVGILGSTPAKAQDNPVQHGLNKQLPNARIKEEKGWNKLNFYEQADKDSAKYKEQLKSDHYFNLPSLDTGKMIPMPPNPYGNHQPNYDPSPKSTGNYKDPNEEKVNRKLAELNKALNQSAVTSRPVATDYKMSATSPITSVNSKDVDRLERLLQFLNQKDTGSDPEMQQLNGMMDKIMDIQHPERVQEKIREQSGKNKQAVFPVTANREADNISLLQTGHENNKTPDTAAVQRKDSTLAVTSVSNAFYSLDNNSNNDEQQNAIQAVVQETQTLVSGATIKLRLTDDVYINGVLIPKDNFVYGMASLNGERLHISISTIRYQNNILPVALSVYDMDGLAGIYIPGAITRDVAKQSADEATQSIGLTTMDPSLGAQAASAGIQAAKTLISKKVKLVKVTVKAGYQVLLRDTNQKQ